MSNRDLLFKPISSKSLLKFFAGIAVISAISTSNFIAYHAGEANNLYRPTVINSPKAPVFNTAAVAKLASASVVSLQNSAGAIGSGFYVTPTLILTNNHVVATPFGGTFSTVTITNYSGTSYTGKIVGSDPELDLALVSTPVKAKPLTFSTTETYVGEPVVTMGAGLGLGLSTSTGTISNSAQSASALAETYAQSMFLDVNIDLNPGNSGGPILDNSGRVVGIATIRPTKDSGGRSIYGVILALPNKLILPGLTSLLHGSPRIWASLPFTIGSGGKVVSSTISSIHPGDTILSVNGHTTSSTYDVATMLLDIKPGSSATVSLKTASGQSEVQHVLVGTVAPPKAN